MKRLWFSLAAALSVAAALWFLRGDRAEPSLDTPAGTSGRPHRRATAPARRDVPTAHSIGVAPLDDADRAAIGELTTAEVDSALEVVVADAQSYWELSPEARADYDSLEAQRLARLGIDDVTHRLAPTREILTLDGKEVTP
jgi:hypothetical protein